jgi:hypothetical protein
MIEEGTLKALERTATALSDAELRVERAAVSLDERQDGEPVTRVILLLNDPSGETWDVDRIRELRNALGRAATELGLPPVSMTLVPESEAEFVEPFVS